MLWHGPTPYLGLTDGPLTTWTYGPVPLLLNLPALLAENMTGALLIAGIINLLTAIVPAALAVVLKTFPSSSSTATTAQLLPAPTDRRWALLLCLTLSPNSSLHYTQSDNAALAFGLLSCLLLVRARDGDRLRRPLSALCAALAVCSKQTSLGLIPAQVLWLGFTAGPRFALRVALRDALTCAAAGFSLAALSIAWFGFDGQWLNLVGLPALFPYAADLLERARVPWLALAGYVVLPAVGMIVARRTVFRRDSPWLRSALV